MIAAVLAADAATAWRRVRRVVRWVRRHPTRTVALIAGVWLTVSVAGGNAILAHAADASDVTNLPYLPPLNAKDSGGVDLLHYVFLPIDRGDLGFHANEFFFAKLIDPIWVFNIICLSWGLWTLQILITMQWVDWVVPPIQAIFEMISYTLSQLGWIPLGLALAGLIGVIAIMRGRVAAGSTEIAISVAASVLAVGLLANPVGMVTGPDGGIRKAQEWGGSIAAAIAGNDSDLLNKPPSPEVAQQIVNDALLGQVMDAWVRYPAQELVFGHVLEGDCAAQFDTAMMQVNPLDTGNSKVRDAVKACDAAAGEYASHANIGQVFTAAIAAGGAGILNLMGLSLGFILLIATGYTIWKAGQWLLATYAAVAPGIARQAWFGAGIGVLVGLFTIGVSIVLVSAFLSIATWSMKTLTGVPLLSTVAQMLVLDVIVVGMIVALIWNWLKAKKAGEKLSERLARLGFGRGHTGPRERPIMKSARRVIERKLADGLPFGRRSGSPTRTPGNPLPGPAAAAPGRAAAAGNTASAAAVKQLGPAVPMLALNAAASSQNGGVKAAATKLLAAGATVGLAAATGGTSAAVLALGKEGGMYVLQRGIQSASRSAPSRDTEGSGATDGQPSDDATAGTGVRRAGFTGFGRRIEVDAAGVSRIAPQQAPHRGGVYRISNAPKSPAPVSALRERLQEAAANQPAGAGGSR